MILGVSELNCLIDNEKKINDEKVYKYKFWKKFNQSQNFKNHYK